VKEDRSQQSVEKLEHCKNNDRDELVISSTVVEDDVILQTRLVNPYYTLRCTTWLRTRI
jgi:hypothetical protein